MKKVVFFLLIASTTLFSATRQEINLKTRTYWGQVYSALSYYPDSILNPVIDDAVSMIAHVGKAIERDTTINLVELQIRYALPSDFDGCLGVMNWSDNSAPVVLDFMTFDDFSKGLVEDEKNAPHYEIWAGYLYPFPRPSETADSLLVQYYATASSMASDTSTCALTGHWLALVPQIAVDLLRIKDNPDPQVLLQIKDKILNFRREHLSRSSVKEVPQQ